MSQSKSAVQARARMLLSDIRAAEHQVEALQAVNAERRGELQNLLRVLGTSRIDNGVDEAVVYKSVSYAVHDEAGLLKALKEQGARVLDTVMPRKPSMPMVRAIIDGDMYPLLRGAARKCCTKSVEHKLRVGAKSKD